MVVFHNSIQAQNVKWEGTTVNFGTVTDWNSPPATFKFKNTGNKKLMFLPQRHGREVLVSYPNQSFQPGEIGEMTIRYYTSETGPFSFTVEVYSNASDKPEKLTVKGNIKSIYANALTACPSFQDPAPVRSSEPNVVQVVDAATERPIVNARVEIFDRGIRKSMNGTNLEGVAVNWIEPDKYTVVASKDGYEKKEEEVTFTKRDRTHVIYLKRTSDEPELNEEEIMVSSEDRWDEQEPVRPRNSKTIPSDYQEPVVETIDLGVTTNLLLEEDDEHLEQMDMGVSTNEVMSEDVVVVPEDHSPPAEDSEESSLDLGITSNDQWEEVGEISEDRIQSSESNEDEIDLGVNTNDQLNEAREEPQPSIEEEVEAALADAESITANREPLTEIEPEPEFSSEKYRPNNVLLLLDVSGSMKDDNKMDKLKASIRRLVMMLREVDVLTLIAYNSTSWEVLPPTPVTDNIGIAALVDSLEATGYTNGVKGMETAYESLEKQLISGGNNQLIIATDGKFNSSKFSEKEAVQMVKDNSDKGIVLSIIGFGDDKEAARLMRKLANLGGGSFLQVDKHQDPTELLADEIKLRSVK